jgi:hypothetical protein
MPRIKEFVRSVSEVLAAVIAEYGTAVAAERRYDSLRREAPATRFRNGGLPDDVPRRLFEELFSARRDDDPV